MKVGIMLMSNKGPDGQPWNWQKHLEECKKHGVEMVDLFDRMLKSINLSPIDAKKILDKIGLSPSVFGVRTDLVSPDVEVRRRSLDTIRYGVDVCRRLEITHLFSHGGQHTNRGEAALNRYIDGLSEAADITGEAGITLSIENAGTLCHTDVELERCIKAVNRQNFKITIDGGNFIIARCDPHRAAKRLAPYVIHVHVKSFIPVIDPSKGIRPNLPYRYCPVGEGLVDYRKIRDILVAAGFDGCMSFEPEGGEDSKWYQSLDKLSKIVKGR